MGNETHTVPGKVLGEFIVYRKRWNLPICALCNNKYVTFLPKKSYLITK